MEICESSEAFVEEDGDLVFSHTKIILRRQDRYFYATTNRRLQPSAIELDGLELLEIPVHSVWPKFHPEFTLAPEPIPPDCYVKQPSLLHYGDTTASLNLGDQLLNEAGVCEILRKHPHRNIAQYLGCIVDGGRIKGLCFLKYSMTLLERLKLGHLDKASCYGGIESGILHLHKLGLVHNDLKPSNIMIDRDDNPVIIDFDSCKPEGDMLGLKGGSEGWAAEGVAIAKPENDLYSLKKIHEFLEG